MAHALVIDDSKTDQVLAGRLLETRLDMTVDCADDGAAALELIARQTPDVIVTDMRMPRVDGLGVVEAVRRDHPKVPVILMTAHGSEELAAEALRKGAAGYVPKRLLSRDLEPTVKRALAIAGLRKHQQHAIERLARIEVQFILDNDTSRIHPVIDYLRQDLEPLSLCDETAMMRIGVAMDEALTNAMTHGNLGVDSSLREVDLQAYQDMLQRHREMAPYRDRHVFVSATFTPERAVYAIRDEGEGFDPASLPDPTDPVNIEKCSGRGLLLIRSFMDEVRFNDRATEIAMIKYRDNRQVAGMDHSDTAGTPTS
jgi:CheY-like chemotaxis protein